MPITMATLRNIQCQVIFFAFLKKKKQGYLAVKLSIEQREFRPVYSKHLRNFDFQFDSFVLMLISIYNVFLSLLMKQTENKQ